MPSASLQKVRIELFFKTSSDLRERVSFLHKHGVKSFNLVNKSNRDTVSDWADVIREEIPKASICAHYSIKYNKSRQKDGAFNLFSAFVKEMGQKEGDNEMLIVTGSGEKGILNSVTAMERLAANPPDESSKLKLAVAYNPFFPSSELLNEEQNRLMRKLDSNQVDKIYIQFGSNLEKLREALDWLAKLRSEKNLHFDVCGSIFLPTKKLIAQQKFRPWNGVFLCDEFLGSETGARSIVVEMMRLYKSCECCDEILIEAPGVRNEKDLKLVESLVQERDSGVTMTKSSNGQVAEHCDVVDVVERGMKRRKVDLLSPYPLVSSKAFAKPAILLFGAHDVRLHDNEAFRLSSFHKSVIPVFLWCKEDQGKWGIRGASEVALKEALLSLDRKLQGSGLALICRSTSDVQKELFKLSAEAGASVVYLNRQCTPEGFDREEKLKKMLKTKDVQVVECQSSLLYDPSNLSLTEGFNGGHWGTLMPFLKACHKQLGEPRRPIQRHETFSLLSKVSPPSIWPESTPIHDLGLVDVNGKDRWDEAIIEAFPMSEDDALRSLENFFARGFHLYEKDRSRADLDHSTSKLSAHLRIGTLSPNELYYKMEDSSLPYSDRKTISRRLVWRDLAYYQLHHFPEMCEKSIRSHYEQTQWVSGEEERRRFEAWKRGKTGFPLVDAGMTELWATGWMTQSIRMIVASFLTEYLRVNWVKGCEWFHYTLVDADPAINAMMWQNAGRSGIDQWNFVMSPTAASQDPTGNYTKQWLPELSNLAPPVLHSPWKAPPEALRLAGVELGVTYPHRIIVDLEGERQTTLKNVIEMRHKNQNANDDRGYDLVLLPNGKETVVFTKKEFRIDRSGNVLKGPQTKKSKGSSKTGRGRRGRVRRVASID